MLSCDSSWLLFIGNVNISKSNAPAQVPYFYLYQQEHRTIEMPAGTMENPNALAIAFHRDSAQGPSASDSLESSQEMTSSIAISNSTSQLCSPSPDLLLNSNNSLENRHRDV